MTEILFGLFKHKSKFTSTNNTNWRFREQSWHQLYVSFYRRTTQNTLLTFTIYINRNRMKKLNLIVLAIHHLHQWLCLPNNSFFGCDWFFYWYFLLLFIQSLNVVREITIYTHNLRFPYTFPNAKFHTQWHVWLFSILL